MQIYKKLKSFISLVCSIAILLSVFVTPVVAVGGKNVTATTSSSIKQGYSSDCYIYIDSTESLAALDVTVHFDPAKIKITGVYNSIDCTVYDSVKNTDNISFSYILDEENGVSSKTRLFYFTYQVLSNAEVGDSYFDITIGEAYDKELNDILVTGSRCKFTIAETVENKNCSISTTSSLVTSVEKEFSLAYRFNTNQIASGSAIITYDHELFEVVEVTNGKILSNKIVDINTELTGAIYVSFVGTSYASNYDFITVKFKTLQNKTESSQIVIKATELLDKDLNPIDCNGYTTAVNVEFDNMYAEDAPKMEVDATYDATTQQVTAVVSLEANSKLGAGDFVIEFDPSILVLSSYEKGFSPDFFNISEKDVGEGKLKFSIISLEDITEAHKVLTIVFDSKAYCGKPTADINIKGSMVCDSLTEPIVLNFIGCNILFRVEHSYSGWSITAQPTCDTAGALSKTCSACGDVVTDTIAALGHSYSTEWVTDKQPTCTKPGSKYIICSTCKKTVREAIAATGHTPGELIVNKEPTAAENGTKIRNCTVCGEILETVDIPQIICEKPVITSVENSENCLILSWKSVFGADSYKIYRKTDSDWNALAEIDGETTSYIDTDVALDTTYSYSVVACNEAGDSQRSDEKRLMYHIHTMGDWIERSAASCTTDGEKYRNCSVCEYEEIEIVEAQGHHFSDEWTIDVEATCTANGTKSRHCTVCDLRTDITGIGATGHYYGEWIIDSEAGCVTAGSKHKTCSACNDVKTEKIKATGHTYSTEWTIDIPKTCTTNGSKSRHCINCDEKTEVTVIAASHDYDSQTTVDIERTCTTGGEISRHCKNCDARTDVLKTTALGHKYENYTVIHEKTCTEDGYAISTCSNCGDQQSYTIRATGHLYSNAWTIDVNVTCTSDGSKSYHCIYCGDRKNVTVIPMTGHSYTWIDDYEQGVSTGVCSNCGDKKTEIINIDSILTFKLNSTSTGYIVSGCIAEVVGQVSIPADYNGLPVLEIGASAFKDCLGITSVTIPEGITKIGNQAFFNCSSLEDVSVPSSATTWGTAIFRKCTSLKNINIPTGLKTLGSATFYGCSNLTEIILPEGMTSIGATSFRDCVSLARVEIPHSVSLINTYAFMNCAGLETVVYRGDENSWASIKINANNTPLTSDKIEYADFTHTMSDDAVIVAPTCITEGKEIYSCVYCGKEVDEIIPATGIHEYSIDWTVDIEPTCKNEGSKSHHCINCEAKTDITPVPKAHVFSTEWTVDTAPTCTVDGSKSRHCTLCDAKTDVTAIAAAHQYSTEWTIDVEPKCTEDGSKSRHCMACEDRTDITIIEAIGHNYILTDVLSEHPHTITHTCSRCDDAIKEDNVISPCLECDYMVKTASNSHRLIAYMGKESEVVIPAIYGGIPVTIIGNSCFRGNDNITSVEISEGIATIDSLAFMECPSLEKVYIPDSVTSIGTQAFYGFNGIIYCNSGSYAHKFAMDNNIKYVLQNIDEQEKPIQETPYTQIDYDNSIIRTSLCASSDITEILNLSDSAVAVARASYVYGDLELYGTGTFITIFDGNEYIGDFLLIVDGDVNGDSICDAIDAFYVAQASNGLRELDDVYELAADSNADNIIDVFDYQAVINKAVS